MNMFKFYYASLSDGDAALRIRTVQAYIHRSISVINSGPPTTPFSSLFFVIRGGGTINGNAIHEGQAYYTDGYSKVKNSIHIEDETLLFMFSFDGIHHNKLISDINVNPDTPATPIDVYNFEHLTKIYNELSDMYPEDVPQDPPQMLSQITAKSYFYQALHCLENENVTHLDTSRRKLLVSAESYMRNHFPEDITIEDVSEHLSIDRRYLYKLFKKYSGTSPKQYLNNIRISRATELLTFSDLSVTQIAEAVGYKDPLQFSAFFKKQTGLSPKKYRETH